MERGRGETHGASKLPRCHCATETQSRGRGSVVGQLRQLPFTVVDCAQRWAQRVFAKIILGHRKPDGTTS